MDNEHSRLENMQWFIDMADHGPCPMPSFNGKIAEDSEAIIFDIDCMPPMRLPGKDRVPYQHSIAMVGSPSDWEDVRRLADEGDLEIFEFRFAEEVFGIINRDLARPVMYWPGWYGVDVNPETPLKDLVAEVDALGSGETIIEDSQRHWDEMLEKNRTVGPSQYEWTMDPPDEK